MIETGKEEKERYTAGKRPMYETAAVEPTTVERFITRGPENDMETACSVEETMVALMLNLGANDICEMSRKEGRGRDKGEGEIHSASR